MAHPEHGTATMVKPGQNVMSADGKQLGQVKEVEGTAFKVDASMQPDYWLPSACVSRSVNSSVELGVAEQQLGEFKLEGPNSTGASPDDALGILVAMHVEAKQQFAAIMQAGSSADAGTLWTKLQPVLTLHEQMEETCLYQPLRSMPGADGKLTSWEPEHQQEVDEVEAKIARLNTMAAGTPQWQDQLKDIHDTLAHHIEEEQNLIFPRIRRAMSQAQLDEAGRKMQAMKSAA